VDSVVEVDDFEVVVDGFEVVVDGVVEVMASEATVEVPVGADVKAEAQAQAEAEAVTVDIDVTSVEEVMSEGWMTKVVTAVDSTALAAEMVADALTDSPALETASAWARSLSQLGDIDLQSADFQQRLRILRQDPALWAGELSSDSQWKTLRSLRGEDFQAKRRRSRQAQQQLLDSLTKLVDRK